MGRDPGRGSPGAVPQSEHSPPDNLVVLKSPSLVGLGALSDGRGVTLGVGSGQSEKIQICSFVLSEHVYQPFMCQALGWVLGLQQ